MEDEDFKIINLFNNELKVFRDGRIYSKYIYKNDCKYGKYKKGQIKWTLRKPTLDKGYLRSKIHCKGNSKLYYIHRIVAYTFLGLDINNPKIDIDHIDHNPQNNYWLNLRIVTHQQNLFNLPNVKGYSYHKQKRKFEARIGLNGKDIHLGYFEKEEDAKNAYLEAKNIYHII